MLIDTKRIGPAIRALRGSIFIKNLLVLMTGTAVAQVIGFALSPVISRLFTPADFGVFGTFSSVLGVLAAAITLEYTQAIFLQKEETDAINLFALSCICTAIISSACLLLGLLFPQLLWKLLKTDSTFLAVLLIIAIATSGLNSACQAWCIRAKAFHQTSTSQVLRSISCNGLQIGLGFARQGSIGLIIGSVIAECVATANLARVTIRDWKRLRHSITWTRIGNLAVQYRDFPAYAATQNIVTTLSQGLPVILLTHYYGITIAGAYAFVMRILQAPMGFVLRALRQVLLQKASETLHSGGPLASLYAKVTMSLIALAVLPLLILVAWAPDLFTLIFGNQWKLAGEFARSLAVWMSVAFCNLPAVLFAQVLRMQRVTLIYDLIGLALRSSVLVLGGLYASASTTIFVYSVVGAAMNVALILIVGVRVAKRGASHGAVSAQTLFSSR